MLAWPYIVSVATADTEYTLPRSTTPTVDTLGVATEAGQTERDTTLSVPDSFHKHFRCGSVQAVMTEAPAASRASRQSPWPGPAWPANEEQRLAATRKLQLLGGEPQPALQRYVDLVAKVLERNLAMLVLFDEKHAEIVSSNSERSLPNEMRARSVCAWSLVPDAPEVLMIEDLTKDARFSDFAIVTSSLSMRSYLGAPIILANGFTVGNLCTLDTNMSGSSSLSAAASRLLVNVAGLVAREIEGLAGSNYKLPLHHKGQESGQQGLMLLDTSQPGWTIMHSDCDAQHLSAKQTEGQALWDIFAVHNVARPQELFETTLAEGKPFRVKATAAELSGQNNRTSEEFQLSFRPGDSALPAQYAPNGTQVGTPAWVSDSRDGQSHVAKLWFVIITGSKNKPRVRFDPTEICHDPVSRGVQAASDSDISSDLTTSADVRGGWEDVEVGYLVGRGSTGSVYRATCHGQQVAVKIIAPAQDKYIKRTPDGIPMEVALTADLRHPNIVRTLRHASFDSQNASLTVLNEGSNWSMASSDSQWGQEAAHEMSDSSNEGVQEPALETWLLLDYCDKGSLLDAVDKGWLRNQASHNEGQVCLVQLLLTALELATALAYLHSVDIMHGDLTGGNVLLHSAPVTPGDSRGFIVKVADFGMSRIHSDLQQACSQGTITHMPPELLCEGQMHRSTDVWSFGILLWEMYTGQRPWHDMSYKQVMQTIGQDKQSPQWPAGAPATLAGLGRACLHLDPDQRPTFREIAQQIKDMLVHHQAADQ